MWQHEPAVIGHIVVWKHGAQAEVWFRPDRWGKVNSIASTGGLQVDGKAIAAATDAARNMSPKNLSTKGSMRRAAYCEFLASVLNTAGVKASLP